MMMTTPPPGQALTAETDWRVGDFAVRFDDHPLVKRGEVHQVTKMYRGGYLGFALPVGGEWNPKGWAKCDASGWIAWNGGENPVPGYIVDVRYLWPDVNGVGDGGPHGVGSYAVDWSEPCLFRLANPSSSLPTGAQHSTTTDFPPDEVLACVGSDDAPVSRPAAPDAGSGAWEGLEQQIDLLRKASLLPLPEGDGGLSIATVRQSAESWRTLARNTVEAFDAALQPGGER